MLYTAKGTAALLVPLANLISPAGNWRSVLWMGAVANVVAALMAILVLRPMRRAHGLRNR
jgi:OFA family oxalate/formate antiporter-like MFS transporter